MNSKGRNPYRSKISVLVDIWTKIISYGDLAGITRNEVRNILYETYRARNITPFKGKANPEDLYDKELMSLYIVGKYGLGLDKQYPEIFDEVFYNERLYEKIIEIMLSNSNVDKVRSTVLNLLGGELDSNTTARILRTLFTAVVLGFRKEEELIELMHRFIKIFPEQEQTIRNYTRFYIAFRVAEAVSKGLIRNKISKEVYKQSLAIKIGFSKIIPDDNYIYSIAREVFHVPDKILRNILNVGNKAKVRGKHLVNSASKY